MQQDFLVPGAPLETPAGRDLIGPLNGLTRTARAAGMAVVFTRQMFRADRSDLGVSASIHPLSASGAALQAGTTGVELSSEIDVADGDLVLDKNRYSAFHGTGLEAYLRDRGIDTVIIAGLVVNVCCESTARDAFFRDFQVIFLADANAAFDLDDSGFGPVPSADVRRCTLSTIARFFGEVTDIDDVRRRIVAI